MLSFVLAYELDLVVFAVIALAFTAAAHVWLKRHGTAGLPPLGRAAVACVVAVAVFRAMIAGNDERGRLRGRLEGIAPTYAQEIALLGHSKLRLDTPQDDPTYQAILNAEIRWEHINHTVSDIYTLRRTADGRVAFLVDSETDYDHNGQFDSDREQRTDVGEIYDQASPIMLSALAGHAGFDGVPVTDRWGTWVTAFEPLLAPDGSVEGAVGVDYDASLWNGDIARAKTGVLGFGALTAVLVLASGIVVTLTRSEAEQRHRLQKELVDASRQAGMAEVATGVLHNVGNVLNSVNISATVLAEKVRGSKLAGLGKAAEMIRDHRDGFADFVTNDSKGKLLPEYLVKVSGLLADEQTALLAEISQLARNVEHVKKIVASQQSMAKPQDITETFELCNLVEDALQLSATEISKARVEVAHDIRICPYITTDRHAVLQILVNLMANAAKAMNGAAVRRLTVGIEVVPGKESVDFARITVADTGVGISPELMKQLFAHGFTTRSDGHGFGLHHSANAAHKLGGELTAASAGTGQGATFTLMLPLVAKTKGIPCPS